MTTTTARVPPTTLEGSSRRHVDFDLHGFVGLRLLEATSADVAAITRQIGPPASALGRDPDITVRFVDRIVDDAPMTYAGWLGAGFTDEAFYVLRGRNAVPARTLLPLADIGSSCHIVCERRSGFVPHLLAIINITALANGVLPLHASAFLTADGQGVLATGWAKGGKTETLLAFAAERGARYIGDEWVYLTPEGTMYGVPEPIRLWHWHVRQLPQLMARQSRATRARLTALPVAAGLAESVSRRLPGNSIAASVLRRAAPVVGRQAFVQVPPVQLFGADGIADIGTLDTLLLLLSHDRDDISVQPMSASEVGGRMLASLEDERASFMACYREFRFAFPDRRSAAVEAAVDREHDLLGRVFADRVAHVVRHPYPVRLESLVEPISAVLRNDRSDSGGS